MKPVKNKKAVTTGQKTNKSFTALKYRAIVQYIHLLTLYLL